MQLGGHHALARLPPRPSPGLVALLRDGEVMSPPPRLRALEPCAALPPAAPVPCLPTRLPVPHRGPNVRRLVVHVAICTGTLGPLPLGQPGGSPVQQRHPRCWNQSRPSGVKQTPL